MYSVHVHLFTESYYFVLGLDLGTNIAVFWSLLRLPVSLYPSSGAQQAGKRISGPSFTVPLSCCLWDNLLCHEPVPESVVCKASLATNSQLNLLSAGLKAMHHHTVLCSNLLYFVPICGSVA